MVYCDEETDSLGRPCLRSAHEWHSSVSAASCRRHAAEELADASLCEAARASATFRTSARKGGVRCLGPAGDEDLLRDRRRMPGADPKGITAGHTTSDRQELRRLLPDLAIEVGGFELRRRGGRRDHLGKLGVLNRSKSGDSTLTRSTCTFWPAEKRRRDLWSVTPESFLSKSRDVLHQIGPARQIGPVKWRARLDGWVRDVIQPRLGRWVMRWEWSGDSPDEFEGSPYD